MLESLSSVQQQNLNLSSLTHAVSLLSVKPIEYRIFCSHFGTFCQTVVKSCSCLNSLRDGLWGRVWCLIVYLCEGSLAEHNVAFLV